MVQHKGIIIAIIAAAVIAPVTYIVVNNMIERQRANDFANSIGQSMEDQERRNKAYQDCINDENLADHSMCSKILTAP